ncbi:MAG: arginine deiminase-related protein [Bacteroidota bacterium]
MKEQITSRILMVRPSFFISNPETAADNHFQQDIPSLTFEQTTEKAQQEFDGFVDKLRQAGVTVYVHQDRSQPKTSDAVFPNNWVSFHEDGTVITYPMFAPSRRLEKQQEIIDEMIEGLGLEIKEQINLGKYESEGRFLESTGSLVIDRPNQIVYAAISERTDPDLVKEFADSFKVKSILFTANQSVDSQRLPIYHTNVVMCLANDFVVICLDSVDDESEKEILINTFQETEKEIIEISESQLECFAGNMLQVKNDREEEILVMSSQAYNALTSEQIQKMESHCKILYSDIETIETLGGGSARCMMAEIFLPEK